MRFNASRKVVAGYTTIAALYIAGSDWLLFQLWPDPALLEKISLFKGFGFVFATALTLYWLLARINARELQRYTALLQNHHAAILVIDPDSGRILDSSAAATNFYGWNTRQLRSMHISEINTLPIEQVKREMDLARNQNRQIFNFQHRLANGEIRDVHVSTGPVEQEGRTVLFSIVHDVTEQHRAQQDLVRLNRLYAMLSKTNLLILRTADHEQLLAGVCEIVCNEGGFVFCWVSGLVNGNGVQALASAGSNHGYLDNLLLRQQEVANSPSGSIWNAVASKGEIFVSNDFLEDTRTSAFHDLAREAGVRASVTLPIHSHGQLLGALNIYSAEAGFFGAQELATLGEMAQDISFGLDNLERIKTLEVASAVIDTSPVVLFRWRAEEGWPVDFVSPNVVQWGYSAASLLSGSVSYTKLIHPDDLERVASELNRHINDRSRQYLETYRIVTASGQVRWVVDQITVIREAEGSPLYFQGVVTDITDRHQMELALQDSDERFRNIVEHATDLIFINRDDHIHYINPAGLRLLKASSAEELIGKSVYSLFNPEVHELMAARIASLRKYPSTTVPKIPELMVALDGTLIDMDVMAASYLAAGRIEIQVTCRDMREQRKAEQTIQEYIKKLEAAVLGTSTAVSQLVELRDPYTAGHERRVGELAADIAAEMGLDDNIQRGLRVAGGVHDVGKIMIPAAILSKPGRLSEIELRLVREHAEQGYQVLKNVAFPWPVAEVARQHHERMNGSGYPQGLKGEEIILEARITAVADVIESMSSHRPYRESLGIIPALLEIEAGSGELYDALVVSTTLRLFREKGYTMPK